MKHLPAQSATTARILRALGIFGGVQVVSILCSVVRTKMAAIWLGPIGVGIMAVYNSTLRLIAGTSQLNLEQSGVRDLSLALDDAERTACTAWAMRRIAVLLSIIAMVLTAACSPLLSRWAFGDTAHTADFIALTPWLFFAAVAGVEMAIMRAHDRLRALARTSIYTAVLSLAAALPLFYYLRLRAIVPVLLIYYAVNFVCALIFRQKPVAPAAHMTLRTALRIARPMLSLGAYMTFSMFVTLLATNVFIIYLNHTGGESVVGIYQAGYTLVETYVGLIFTAIAMEYYPRLSTVSTSAIRTEVVVSHEIKIALYVLMPVLVAFICSGQFIIKILYSSSFEAALPFVVFGAAGVIFRAASWCLAYVILARGDGRIYIVSETLSAIAYLALYMPLYHYYGYAGLGIGYVAWYAVYFAVTYAIYRRRYGLRLRRGIAALVATAFGIAALTVALYYIIGPIWTVVLLLPPTAYLTITFVLKRPARKA